MTKLSITIPNFNGAGTMERCIRSCSNVKLPKNDFEIVVIDNCSNDNSMQIIKELSKEYENLRIVVNEQNVGRIQNWNRCIEEAKGKFLVFLFTNDTINESNNLEKIIPILDSDESISTVVSPFAIKTEDNVVVKRKISDVPIMCSSSKFIELCLKRSLFPLGVHSIIFRLVDIKKINNTFFDEIPILADQVFSFIQAHKRDHMLFNTQPQTTWNVTSKRFHFKIKLEDAMKQHKQAQSLIVKELKIQIKPKLISTYYLLNFLASLNNKNSFSKTFSLTISNFLKSKYLLPDSIFLKAIFKKILNNEYAFYELFLKELIHASEPKILTFNT